MTKPTPRQARILWYCLTSLAVAVILGLVGIAVWGFGRTLGALSPVLLPVAIALVLAYILDPAVEFFVRRKIPRVWSIVLVFALGLAVVGGVVGSVVPGLIQETRTLVSELPKSPEEMRARIRYFFDHTALGRRLISWHLISALAPPATTKPANQPPPGSPPPGTAVTQPLQTNQIARVGTNNPSAAGASNLEAPTDERISEIVMFRLTELAKMLAKGVGNQLAKASTWLDFMIGFVLVPVCLFYFLLEKEAIQEHWTNYLPIQESKAKEELIFVLRAINECLIVFFRGQVLVAVCAGVLLTIGYLIIGLNYAVLIGLTAAVLEIVPYLGTIITLLIAVSVAAVQFGDWLHPLLMIGLSATVKIIEDFVISPKILGERSGLHPLTVIIAVMAGTTVVGGLLGALISIPLTAVLRTLMFRYVWKAPSKDPVTRELNKADSS